MELPRFDCTGHVCLWRPSALHGLRQHSTNTSCSLYDVVLPANPAYGVFQPDSWANTSDDLGNGKNYFWNVLFVNPNLVHMYNLGLCVRVLCVG